jgi:hypothetical protein
VPVDEQAVRAASSVSEEKGASLSSDSKVADRDSKVDEVTGIAITYKRGPAHVYMATTNLDLLTPWAALRYLRISGNISNIRHDIRRFGYFLKYPKRYLE